MPTNAATLNCPSCGAAAPAAATECAFCHAKLATIGCPSCFGLVFAGAKFCDHCGAKIEAPVEQAGTTRTCPRGCGNLKAVTLGEVQLDECPACNGLWLDPATFDHLCAEKEQTASALFGAGTGLPQGAKQHVETVRYVPCPVCGKLMNRTNFARSSGVIVDTCRNHGIWFDADELRRVIEFVRGGGLDLSRKREMDQLAEERRLRELSQSLDTSGEGRTIFEQNRREVGPGATLLTTFLSFKL